MQAKRIAAGVAASLIITAASLTIAPMSAEAAHRCHWDLDRHPGKVVWIHGKANADAKIRVAGRTRWVHLNSHGYGGHKFKKKHAQSSIKVSVNGKRCRYGANNEG